jgi:hypothetical protein
MQPLPGTKKTSGLISFTKTQFTLLLSGLIIAGAAGAFIGSITAKPSGKKGAPRLIEKKEGAITISQAEKYAIGHRDDGDNEPDWREQSQGVTYDIRRLSEYTKSLETIINGKDTLPGYSWKVAIMYGGAFKKQNDEALRINTMFVPVLVKNDSLDRNGKIVIDRSDKVVDIFEAKYCYDKKIRRRLNWEPNSISRAYYYDSLYKRFYLGLEKILKTSDSCTKCIVFDEGHLFP